MRTNLLSLVCSLLWFPVSAQKQVLHTEEDFVMVRHSDRETAYRWNLNKELQPDENTVGIRQEPVLVTYYSSKDSVIFELFESSRHDFVIVRERDTFPQRIRGKKYVPRVNFTEEFMESKRGKTEIEIPEVYEMASIIIAITDQGLKRQGLVNQSTPYYKEVINHFLVYRNEKVVHDFEQIIRSRGEYELRTNGLAFSFEDQSRIKKSEIYNRVVYNENTANVLDSLIQELQEFADNSDFRSFYQSHKDYYTRLTEELKADLDVSEMLGWLQREFPEVSYDYYHILVSPLTGHNQGLMMFEDKGFKELQIHVNLPYEPDARLSQQGRALWKRSIVFTELNHGFVDKTAADYREEIRKAIDDDARKHLITDKFGPGYYASPEQVFQEYLNWGLVALRYQDLAEEEDLPLLLNKNVAFMEERRGFKKFSEFQHFLLDLYQMKDKKTPLATLYPQIINWFERILDP